MDEIKDIPFGTELPPHIVDAVRKYSDDSGMTIKAIVLRALVYWMNKNRIEPIEKQ